MDKDYGGRTKGLFWFPLPSLEDYWKRDPVFHYLPIADHISRDHFQAISRCLHFVNNDTLVPRGQPGHDRWDKVWPVIDHLFQRFSDLYDPHCELAGDEVMIKFQGRSSLKQYTPMKPIKRDIKVWVLGIVTMAISKSFRSILEKKVLERLTLERE